MSTLAVERVRQIMECNTAQQVAPLVENHDAIAQVMKWLEDEPSRTEYERELVFMALCRTLNNTVAFKYAGNMSAETWQNRVAEVKRRLAAGTVPDIERTVSTDMFYYNLAATFVQQQYTYLPHVTVREGDVVLDCGACFGDTTLWAAMQGAKTVHAFEPNPQVFPVLQRNLANFAPANATDNTFVTVNKGLADAEGTLPFAALEDAPGSSRLNEQGNVTVPITPIDRYCEENRVVPSFIKMDIEGAEVQALKGAQNTIAKYKPRLAICLYHRLSDMWVIPHSIKSIRSDYKLFCKKNALISEFVLYAY